MLCAVDRPGDLEHFDRDDFSAAEFAQFKRDGAMPVSIQHARARQVHGVAAVVSLSIALFACSPQTETSAPQPRPVRTVIDQIESERSQGKDVWQATVDASSTRFRPIMSTAISTVLGMIPIAPTVFWGPMAFAIMGGLLVGTILTLVFLPTLYVAWFRGKESSSDQRPATAS